MSALQLIVLLYCIKTLQAHLHENDAQQAVNDLNAILQVVENAIGTIKLPVYVLDVVFIIIFNPNILISINFISIFDDYA